MTGNAIVFDGVFDDWQAAERVARGYADSSLIQRVEGAALLVKSGQAAWEQDGVAHDRIPEDFPQLACLSQAALANDGTLTVLDFGGGLGSAYYQTRHFMKRTKKLRWHIVEQEQIVSSGKRHFQTEELQFHESIEQCMSVSSPNTILLSSVLQYLEDPYTLLELIAKLPIEFLIIDRHPQTLTRELITVQKIPRKLYPASYPAWLFDMKKMDSFLSIHFEQVACWDGKDPQIRGRNIGANYIGQFWQKRGHE